MKSRDSRRWEEYMTQYTWQPQLQIAVCDDDPAMLQRLVALITESLSGRYSCCVHTAASAEELLAKKLPFHLAVLDIELPNRSGIELATAIIESSPHCRVLFVSGYARYVSDVYDVPHVGMILKDQLEHQLPKFLLRSAAFALAEAGAHLTLQDGAVPVADICYMERQGHWTHIYLRDGSQRRTREKLDSILRRIGNPAFSRCHISYVVHLPYVKAMTTEQLTLQNGQILPVSRPNRVAVKNAFFQYISEHT